MAPAMTPKVSRWFKPDDKPRFIYHSYSQIFEDNNKLRSLEAINMCNGPNPFDMRAFCSAIQHDVNVAELRNVLNQYIERYPCFPQFLRLHAKSALFYAVAFHRIKHRDLLLSHKVVCIAPSSHMALPLLVFTILNGAETATDTSEVVPRLLCTGLDPRTIPEEIWTGESQAGNLTAQPTLAWCT
jgi:hypothetical protein